MRSSLRPLLATSLVVIGSLLHLQCSRDDDPPARPVVDAETGFDVRPKATHCQPPAVPASLIEATRIFPSVTIREPVMLLRPSSTLPWYVLEQNGRVLRVPDGATAAEVVLDLSDVVDRPDTDAGMLGIAFSPQFAATGEVFVAYTAKSTTSLFTSVVSRFKSRDGGRTLDRSTEQTVLAIPRDEIYHHGGRLVFGPDGYLYVGMGDGSFGDPRQNAQNRDLLFGKILRIDVLAGRPYAIPSDNPFASGGGRPEIFALGFRNPWSFSFDESGALWVGDVGHEHWEEIDRVVKGGNYGWPLREGTHCFATDPCDVPPTEPPIYEYPHLDGFSVTGGLVYRGTRIPSLRGKYVFGDFVNGRISVLEDEGHGVVARELLASGLGLASFAEGPDHELYVVDYFGGGLYRLDLHDVLPAAPTSLAALGCLGPNDPARMAMGLIPYDVISPLWSDGFDKQRWVSIPDGTTIHVEPDGDWTLPPGSLLLKTFSHEGRRVETRMMVNDPTRGWLGHTFEWNEAQTDAVLLDEGKTKRVGDVDWQFPSRSQCFSCHTSVAGRTLGLENAQLNRDVVYPRTRRRANQLTTFSRAGLLDAPVDAALAPRLADPSADQAPLEDRARSYLHANCSFCHRPFGPGRGIADLRASATLADTGLLCNAPFAGDLGTNDGLLVAPGQPERSVVAARMLARGAGRMPPLGTARVDEEGAALLTRWIMSISSCD